MQSAYADLSSPCFLAFAFRVCSEVALHNATVKAFDVEVIDNVNHPSHLFLIVIPRSLTKRQPVSRIEGPRKLCTNHAPFQVHRSQSFIFRYVIPVLKFFNQFATLHPCIILPQRAQASAHDWAIEGRWSSASSWNAIALHQSCANAETCKWQFCDHSAFLLWLANLASRSWPHSSRSLLILSISKSQRYLLQPWHKPWERLFCKGTQWAPFVPDFGDFRGVGQVSQIALYKFSGITWFDIVFVHRPLPKH